MTDAETDALVEAMAIALAKNDDKWGEIPWPALGRVQTLFISDARAILPIIAAHTAAAVAAERERAVAWLRDDAQRCDCAAHSDSECACGAWDDWKTVAMPTLIERFADAIPHKPSAGHPPR